jgi:HEAT repeat protein
MTELEYLCAELVSGDDARSEQAALRLPELGQAGLDALRPLLKTEIDDVRWWAIRALAGFANVDEIIPDLIAALRDESDEVRQAAAMAFCHHPVPAAVSPLIRVLSDPDSLTAKLASNALILIGIPATSALLDMLKNGQSSAKLEAVRALAEIKDPNAIPGLMKALETDSALMQYWASLGLEKLGVGMVYLKPE